MTFQKSFITWNAANVFGRLGTGAVKANRLLGSVIGRKQFFKLDRMMPVIAKIINVREPRSDTHEIPQTNFLFIKDPRIVLDGAIRQGCDITVPQAADTELVEVIVPPVD